MWSYIRVTCVVLPPLFLQALLAHIAKRSRGEDDDAPTHVAVLYVLGMFLSQVVASLAASQSLYIGRRVCIRLRAIIITEIFTKSLRKKLKAGGKGTEADKKDTKDKAAKEDDSASSGKITNLISVDTFRCMSPRSACGCSDMTDAYFNPILVSEVCAYLHFLWPELPLTIIIVIYLLFNLLGISALAGLGALAVLTPLQALILKLYYKYQKKLLAAADERLNLTTEVLSSIRRGSSPTLSLARSSISCD